jgi:hypothetical protein
VLLAKEKTMLQGMMNRLTEIERCYGMEINVKNTKVMNISRQPAPVQMVTDGKQRKDVECFNYLGNMITNDARCTFEIKSKIAMAKAAFSIKNIFHQDIRLRFKDETNKILRFVCVKNDVLHRVKEESNILHNIRRRKANWIRHFLHRNCLLKDAIEGKKEI